jgi:hypothetical protein
MSEKAEAADQVHDLAGEFLGDRLAADDPGVDVVVGLVDQPLEFVELGVRQRMQMRLRENPGARPGTAVSSDAHRPWEGPI